MSKMNLEARKKNCIDRLGGKRRNVRYFSKNELWKFIGCILSKVTHRKE